MTATISLQMDELPGMLGLLGRGAICRKPAQSTPAFPDIEARVAEVRADPRKVAQYSQVCGFGQSSDSLPITYPHILAFRLHMEMLLQRDFPLAPMGLVHLRNDIVQHRPIATNEAMEIHCCLAGHRLVDKGVEFDLRSDVRVGGELVWEDLSVYMARLPGRGQSSTSRPKAIPQSYEQQLDWKLPANLGRRYAAASGDFNPIHLYAPTAKLLGFKRQIAHGMWSKARCAAALQPKLGSDACHIAVEFKTPVYLPSTVKLHFSASTDDGGIAFELRNVAGNRPHLRGEINKL